MPIDELRKARAAEPFKPFTVQLADGRAFDIPHPEFLALPPEGRRSAIVFLPGDQGFEIIDPTLVTSLSFKTNGKRGGGSSRRKAGFSGVLILLLLIGVAIILVLAFGNLGGGKSYTQTVVDSKKDAEGVSLGIKGQQLAILIADFRMNNEGKAPVSYEDMGADASSFLDPWGRALRFRFDGPAREAREFIIISDGPDGTPGTADDIEQRVGLPF